MNKDHLEFREIYKDFSEVPKEYIDSHLKNENCFEKRTTYESLYRFDFKNNEIDITCSNTLIIHIYYPEIVKTFEPYILNTLICGGNIIVNVPDHNGQDYIFIKEFFNKFKLPSQIKIIKSKNTGRDWGGLYKSFKSGDCGDVITFIHTKFSPHLHPIFGTLWRHRLISPLLGTVSNYQNNLELISRKYTSLVAADSCELKLDNTASEDYNNFKNIFSINIDATKNANIFVAGSMFMVHKDVLSQIFEILDKIPNNPLDEDYNDLSQRDQRGGKFPHYLERFIFTYAEQLNGVSVI